MCSHLYLIDAYFISCHQEGMSGTSPIPDPGPGPLLHPVGNIATVGIGEGLSPATATMIKFPRLRYIVE